MERQAQHVWLQEQLEALGENWQINQSGHLFKAYPQQNLAQAFEQGTKLLARLPADYCNIEFIVDSQNLRVEILGHKPGGLQNADFAIARLLDT